MSQVCFAIILGTVELPTKLWKESYRNVELLPIEEFASRFKNGDTLEDQKKKFAPRHIMTKRGMTDINLHGIRVACERMQIWSYHLEEDSDSGYMFLIGSV